MKNFLKGYGSALMLIPPGKFPRVKIEKLNFPKSSAEGIRRDWEAIGKSLSEALNKVGEEIEGERRE